MEMLKELLSKGGVSREMAPLILSIAVTEINKAPIDGATRLRTYDEFADALKERLRDEVYKR